jgi:hypothetical protein
MYVLLLSIPAKFTLHKNHTAQLNVLMRRNPKSLNRVGAKSTYLFLIKKQCFMR